MNESVYYFPDHPPQVKLDSGSLIPHRQTIIAALRLLESQTQSDEELARARAALVAMGDAK